MGEFLILSIIVKQLTTVFYNKMIQQILVY